MFCQSCGRAMAETASVCPNCGAPVKGMAMSSVAPSNAAQHVSGAWYLAPLFFGIIGGIIAWAVNKDKDPKRARNLLIFGLVWTLLPVVIALAIFLCTLPFIPPPTYPYTGHPLTSPPPQRSCQRPL